MSEEISEYRMLLEDIARVIGVETTRPDCDRPRHYPAKDIPIPDRRLRDDIMRRLGVMQDAHGRMEGEYRCSGDVSIPPEVSISPDVMRSL